MKPFIALTAAIATAGALAALVRFLVVEPEGIAHLCGAVAAPWWCTLRAAVVAVFSTGALAVVAVGFGVAAIVTRRAGVALAAACLGVAGLLLYSVEPGAVALLLGLLALARAGKRQAGAGGEREA